MTTTTSFRGLIATGAAMLVALAVGGGVAKAQLTTDPQYTISCQFSALMGTADPDGPGSGVQSVTTDTSHGGSGTLATDFDRGGFTFTGPATCLVEDDLYPQNNGAWSATINSSGDYRNYVCSTGHFESTPSDFIDPDPDQTTINFTSMPSNQDVTKIEYDVTFHGGNGQLHVLDGEMLGHGARLTGKGALHIHPTIGNCVTTDVQQWAMAGAFTLSNTTATR